MSDHASHGPSTGGKEGFWGKPVRNTAIAAGGVAVLAGAAGSHPGVLKAGAGTILGAISGVGEAAFNILNTITPTAIAAAAAPLATAGSALYLANHGLDMAGIDHVLTRRIAQAASIVAGVGASALSPLLVGGAATLGIGKLGLAGWNKLRAKAGFGGAPAHA